MINNQLPQWQRSSYCGTNACVEVAQVSGQFMVRDSKKYAATGGWGYSQFDDGKPADASMLTSCFPCHQLCKDRDFIFTRYAP